MTSLTLNLSSLVDKISDRDLEMLSRDNPDARLETNSEGQLIFMSPTGSETGDRNLELAFQIKLWNKQNKLGKVFDSSTGFKLSNNAVRSPDVSWVTLDKWNSLTKQQRRKFAPIDPDFVLELMSPSDDLDDLQNKMREYMNCGVKLGWLINPDDKQVEIYRQGKNKEVLENPLTLSGEDIMPGLIVDLSEIFD
ncbi:Uma2 family endonuclease [Pleurocapsa sp. PCC 7319]|uniref:Uma2 family endonuclease n=1 Tax=Pleurocapsa sp. PCC 7319 TaxID=118161 RepID=UPI00034CD2B4|nr:Uma2 family endonuclease [Pleurocapsa sp. PCC 7319]